MFSYGRIKTRSTSTVEYTSTKHGCLLEVIKVTESLSHSKAAIMSAAWLELNSVDVYIQKNVPIKRFNVHVMELINILNSHGKMMQDLFVKG